MPVLLACSPTYNWRELRLEGTPLQALMPCKPEQADRQVPLGGVTTELHMRSCETGGVRFALAWATLDDPGRVEAALADWARAGLRAVRAEGELPGAESLQTVSGADRTRWVRAQGSDHQGRPLQTQVLYFVQGRQVYQAAVYGVRLPPEAVTPFFESLRLP